MGGSKKMRDDVPRDVHPSLADARWNWENRRINPSIASEAGRRLDGGGTVEDALAYLRASGATATDSIIFMRLYCGMSAKEAQTILHSSETWSELRGR